MLEDKLILKTFFEESLRKREYFYYTKIEFDDLIEGLDYQELMEKRSNKIKKLNENIKKQR